MDNVIASNAKVTHGTACFSGTRVPVKSLFDYLEDGCNVEFFLEQFPSVQRQRVIAVLESFRSKAEENALAVVA